MPKGTGGWKFIHGIPSAKIKCKNNVMHAAKHQTTNRKRGKNVTGHPLKRSGRKKQFITGRYFSTAHVLHPLIWQESISEIKNNKKMFFGEEKMQIIRFHNNFIKYNSTNAQLPAGNVHKRPTSQSGPLIPSDCPTVFRH